MALLKPATNIDPSATQSSSDINIVDDSALMPDEGPTGTIADLQGPKGGKISEYVVREGDSLSSIAKMFNLPVNTILWANDLTRDAKIKVGDKLTILPIPSVPYTIKKGDTVASIAKRFGGDPDEITSYNNIDGTLIVGTQVLIPDGEMPVQTPAPSKTIAKGTKTTNEPAHNVGPKGSSSQVRYYIRPIVGGVRTQGVHGYNAVDLAAPVGTPILAAADGEVIIAKEGGWNGGYGNYIVIQHDNGSQTLYGHASQVIVSVGQDVHQGQVIGYVGSTGKSTGPHVHFEIRNGIRNPF